MTQSTPATNFVVIRNQYCNQATSISNSKYKLVLPLLGYWILCPASLYNYMVRDDVQGRAGSADESRAGLLVILASSLLVGISMMSS